jgi:type III secretion protein T
MPKGFGLDLFVVIMIEFFKGYILGFSIGWIFWAMEAVGNVIDNQRGAAIATAVNPLLGQEASPVAILYSQAMISYFYSAGGIFVFLNIFYLSFSLWHPGDFLPMVSTAAAPVILKIFSDAVHVMFLLAAPLVLIMFIAEFALAMVSRFSPQIQVFILAMPIKSALVTLMLIYYFKMSLDYMIQPPVKFYNDANAAIRSLGGQIYYQDVVNPRQEVP